MCKVCCMKLQFSFVLCLLFLGTVVSLSLLHLLSSPYGMCNTDPGDIVRIRMEERSTTLTWKFEEHFLTDKTRQVLLRQPSLDK